LHQCGTRDRMAKIGSFLPKETKMTHNKISIHVSLVVIPDVMLSSLLGLFDVLNCFELIATFDKAVSDENPFHAEIIAQAHEDKRTASGLTVAAHRTIEEIDHTDIIIIPSMMVEDGVWKKGRYPAIVNWLSDMHAKGAMLCSACSGVLLLAETGLIDGREATIHWAYARTFRHNFPNVHLRLEKVLVTEGDRQQFVMSGASGSWHDLVLYIIARHIGPAAAQGIAKFMLLQWHVDGQAPYVVFDEPIDHGDSAILDIQNWLNKYFTIAAPVEEMVKWSGLAERSFKRRFKIATGYSPIVYVQHVRVEEAKRRLERTNAPIDEISWAVGYEDPSFFRRLFKRITLITPGAYRRKFRLPDFATTDIRNRA